MEEGFQRDSLTSSPLADLSAGSERPTLQLKEVPTKEGDSTPFVPPPVDNSFGLRDADRETATSTARIGAKKAPSSPKKKGKMEGDTVTIKIPHAKYVISTDSFGGSQDTIPEYLPYITEFFDQLCPPFFKKYTLGYSLVTLMTRALKDLFNAGAALSIAYHKSREAQEVDIEGLTAEKSA
jgi:hypothetical protein